LAGTPEQQQGGLHAHIWEVPNHGRHQHSIESNVSPAGDERRNTHIWQVVVDEHQQIVGCIALCEYFGSWPPIAQADGQAVVEND
jgi:hypothetical protein